MQPRSQRQPIVAGTLLGDKYRVLKQLGAGGFGRVFLAHNENLGTQVAIKVAHEAEGMQRFRREARLAASLSSPYSVRVYDVGNLDDGSPFIVMECLTGFTLREYLRERHRVAPRLALEWGQQMCAALREAHAMGLVHRDIKPSNLFLVRKPGVDEHIKLVDFGLAKALHGTGSVVETDSGLVMGSPAYLAPERLRSGESTPLSDIWSVGVVLFEMLSGQLPFSGENNAAMLSAIAADPPRPLLELVPDLPRELAAITARCLRKHPPDRFPSVEALRLALAAEAEAFPSRSGPMPSPPETPASDVTESLKVNVREEKEPARWRWWFAAGVAVLGAIAALRSHVGRQELDATSGEPHGSRTVQPPPPLTGMKTKGSGSGSVSVSDGGRRRAADAQQPGPTTRHRPLPDVGSNQGRSVRHSPSPSLPRPTTSAEANSPAAEPSAPAPGLIKEPDF